MYNRFPASGRDPDSGPRSLGELRTEVLHERPDPLPLQVRVEIPDPVPGCGVSTHGVNL